MASIANDPNGRRRVQFVAPDGKRKSIRLGKVSKRAAEEVKGRVEWLLEALRLGRAMSADLAEWVSGLDDKMADRLVRVGLIPEREKREATTLVDFLKAYDDRRIDVKPATHEVWSQSIRNLTEHFGTKKMVRDVTVGDAEDFKLYLLGRELAPTTVHKRLQFARQFYRDAVKRGFG